MARGKPGEPGHEGGGGTGGRGGAGGAGGTDSPSGPGGAGGAGGMGGAGAELRSRLSQTHFSVTERVIFALGSLSATVLLLIYVAEGSL